MSHIHQPPAASETPPARIQSDVGDDGSSKSVRVNLEVNQSCRLLTDSALQLLNEDVSECSFPNVDFFFLIFFFIYQANIMVSYSVLHFISLHSLVHFFFPAYQLLFSILWSEHQYISC